MSLRYQIRTWRFCILRRKLTDAMIKKRMCRFSFDFCKKKLAAAGKARRLQAKA